MKVLLAEDAPTSRMMLEEWLRIWEFEPVVAADGEEAWAHLQNPAEEVPRLALIDWMMPRMDGLTLCQKIKAAPQLPFVYVILLTSKNSKEDLVTGLDAGADDFLSKPVQPEELHSRLNVGGRILDYQCRLEAMDEQKNKFLGMVAHDLRNPLASIMGFSELLLGTEVPETSQREFLQVIHKASEEMLGLLNNLLDISVIESGQFDMALQPTDLIELVNYRLRLNQVKAQNKGMKLTFSAAPAHLEIACDGERIAQVLDNLLSNAIKYAPPDSEVSVQLQDRPDQVEVSVTDQGPGIPAEKRDRLFGTFQKLGSKTTGGEKSTGLGLAIVKKIIAAHGGEVGIAQEMSQGSRFYFTLPKKAAA